MMKIIFPDKPIAKKRPRFFVRNTKKGHMVGVYDEQGEIIKQFKSFLKSKLPNNYELITGAIFCQLWYGIGRPKSHYGIGRNEGVLKKSAPKYPLTIPDIDNYEKFVFDCCNGVIWKDDKQVVACFHEKKYSDNPRVEILVEILK